MKLATFARRGIQSWGIVEGERIRDAGARLGGEYKGLRDVIAANAYDAAAAAGAAAPDYALSEITFLPVIPDPGKILCIGLNYESHRQETGRKPAGHPTVFIRFADSQIGHGAPIVRPRVSASLDYEGELAIVIGKGGRSIAADDAMDHVAGYACYNDGSVRDWQNHTHQFAPGKNFPGTGAFGPWLVTADEISDYRTLHLATRVNGETLQSAGLDQMIFPIPALIEYCSAFTPLSAGDVIVTGTPGGVGFKRTPPLFLKPGDKVEVEIARVGLLENGVSDE